MFEVLAFVYDNFFSGDSYPDADHLERKLTAVGFESDEVQDAMRWLNGLHAAAPSTPTTAPPTWLLEPSANSLRIYSAAELHHLGPQCLGFLVFMESVGGLSAPMREVVLDRALAACDAPIQLDDFKLIILMVCWRFGHQPDTLVLDELCEDRAERVLH